MEDNKKLSTIQSVVHKEEIKKEISGVRVVEIDAIDFPAYEYFESVKQNNVAMEYYPIMTSRGCPYSCSFCAGPKISGKK